MKAVIPAKASSTRVPNKNYRPFHDGRCLLDLLIDKLGTILHRSDIFVSSEDLSRRQWADERGVSFLPRAEELARNATPFASVVRQICSDVPGDDDIMWCHATDPMFDAHKECVAAWSDVREDHDSLVVVYPRRKYLLDGDHRPIGFGFGPWHIPSQSLPVHYELPFTLSILRREAAVGLGPIGADPFWFHADNVAVDIDTEDEFWLAQQLYAASAAR